jgi:hypothetical protein
VIEAAKTGVYVCDECLGKPGPEFTQKSEP